MRGPARLEALAALVLLAGTPTVAPAADAKPGASASGKPAQAASASASAIVSAPIEFDGMLESGKSYVGDVAWDNNALHIWRPLKDVKVPRGHAWTIDWTNLAKFPTLKTPAARARPQRFQFKVVGVDVSSGSPMIPWTTIYRCEVIATDAAAGVPAGPNRRK